MDFVTCLYLRLKERQGQTMGEYALILAAVAVVAFAGYQLLGTDINTLVSNVGGDL